MDSRLSALLWEHDPNGLLVVDRQLAVRTVNPAFCTLFTVTAEEAEGRPVAELIGDSGAFEQAFREPATAAHRDEQSYPERNLHVQRIIFAVPGEDVVAAIFVDLTSGRDQSRHIKELREEVAREVREVVDRQMAVAQEIAGLLGETTADSKVALLRLLDTIRRDNG